MFRLASASRCKLGDPATAVNLSLMVYSQTRVVPLNVRPQSCLHQPNSSRPPASEPLDARHSPLHTVNYGTVPPMLELRCRKSKIAQTNRNQCSTQSWGSFGNTFSNSLAGLRVHRCWTLLNARTSTCWNLVTGHCELQYSRVQYPHNFPYHGSCSVHGNLNYPSVTLTKTFLNKS
jgi:hypothetical protein